MKDAYGLASFFTEDERLGLYRCDVAQDDYATPAFLFPQLNRLIGKALAEVQQRVLLPGVLGFRRGVPAVRELEQR